MTTKNTTTEHEQQPLAKPASKQPKPRSSSSASTRSRQLESTGAQSKSTEYHHRSSENVLTKGRCAGGCEGGIREDALERGVGAGVTQAGSREIRGPDLGGT